MNKIAILLSTMLLLASCSNELNLDSPPIQKFFIVVENSEGEDLLSENVKYNILGEKIEYVIDGDTLEIAWQQPYPVVNYNGCAYIKEMIFIADDNEHKKMNAIATNFSWICGFESPVTFKLNIGKNEFPFTLYTLKEGKKTSEILILPDGSRKHISSGFTIKITLLSDGNTSVSVYSSTKIS